VQSREDDLSDDPSVAVEQGEGTNPHQHDEDTLGKLEGGDSPEHAPLAGMRTYGFSVLGHER